MSRVVLLAGVILLTASSSFAYAQDPTPDQCQLIKQAVAQYGYAAAKKHALENYGPEAVKVGEKCFSKQFGRGASANGPAFGRERSEDVKWRQD